MICAYLSFQYRLSRITTGAHRNLAVFLITRHTRDHRLDRDCSGSVSAAEMLKIFTALVPKGTDKAIVEGIVMDLLREGDTSGDGELSREEVRAISGKIRSMFS